MGDQPQAGGRRGASPQPPKERPGRGTEPPGRRRGSRRRSLRALGSLVSRLLKTLSALSHLGGGSRRGGAEPEDDEGGFRGPPAPPPAGPPGAAPPEEQVGGGSGWPEARRSWSPPGGAAEGRPPGVQGLKNHGNTCFMNAVVQCLSNTDLLAEFLGLERYRARGAPGEVTQQLAALVRALWTLDYTPQLSVEFKNIVAKYGAQFRGNSQHDALEFLLWLLDRMHEDLGSSSPSQKARIAGKPQPSLDESCGSGHAPPATQPPSRQSFVQNHFQAQYRSSLTCPHCLKQSNTFDPFLCVSLPIPLRQTRPLNVTLVFQSKSQRFLRIGLAVPLFSTVATLRAMVAEEGKITPDQVILAELSPSGFQRSFHDEEDLNAIAEGDSIYAFQAPMPFTRGSSSRLSGCPLSLPSSPNSSDPEGQRLPHAGAMSSEFLHHGGGGRVLLLLCNTAGTGLQAARFGPPLLTREDRAISWEQLQQSILSKIRYLMRSEAQVQGVGDLFRVRVAGGSVACSYLSPQDSRPLYHPAVDRALQFGGPGGPHHVKLAVEWDLNTKERLFGSIQEEVVQDTESVRLQQQAHQQQHSCTLDECFQLYTKEEQLAPDDAWRCPHCQVLQQGMVKLSLWTLPDILIIHLKRFHQVGERRTKLSTLVRFPLRGLNMAPHVAKRSQAGTQALGPWATWKQLPHLHESSQLDCLYDLYAVCNHHGSMQGGHYTAYCRNALDGRWYSYDDSTVEPVLEDEVSTRGAYILFYQRMNVIPSWSASNSMKGSTSSSMSDHWLARLSGSSKRESLVSRSSTACPSLLKAPDSPVFLDTATSQEKGGFESRPLVRGIQGRSVSMKVSPTKPKLGATKPVPLRWSFAARDRPQAASGELVEYLESGRRPRYTNESIVPLMTGGSENTPVPARPLLNPAATGKDQGTGGAGRASGNSQGAVGGAAESHGKAPPATEMAGTLKRSSKPKEEAGQPQRTSKKLELPVNSGGPRSAEEPKSNGSKGSSNGAARAGTLPHPHRSLRARGALGRDEDHDQRTPAKAGEHGRDRDPEAERQPEGKFTIFRAGFLKKEPKRPGESELPHASEPAMGSSRTSLSNGTLSVISEGRVNGMLGRRGKEGQANGRISRSEVDIKRSQSSASIHSKADWVLRRSASLYKNGGGSHQHSHSVPLEKAAYGTLQRAKYHTASLGRKKPVPESSF
ncbi:ubiquitin carboxyl-terminal hydrolase 43 [Lepidochelys kempii]|uniref:ubiquitin carboxyl-terminal hydrolase 43 n=1 Tax=Lepidochelys kempii TaxID=8472 RepID=UPI003C7040BF